MNVNFATNEVHHLEQQGTSIHLTNEKSQLKDEYSPSSLLGRLHEGFCKPPRTPCVLKCHPHKHPGLWQVDKRKAKVLQFPYLPRGSPQDSRHQLALNSWSPQVSAENTVSDVSPPAPQVSLRPPIPDCRHHPPAGRPEGRRPFWHVQSTWSKGTSHRDRRGGQQASCLPAPIWLIPRDPCRMAMLTVLHQPPPLSSPRVFSAKERNASTMRNA